MHLVKVKPVYLSKNEVLVKPPDVILKPKFLKSEKIKNFTVSSVKDVKPYLEQRKASRESVLNRHDTEEDAVKKLNDFKRSSSPCSPLLKKYSFKRASSSIGNASESKIKSRSSNYSITIQPCKNVSFVGKVLGIFAVERMKKKNNEEQARKISENNQMMEEKIKFHITNITRDIQVLKSSVKTYSEKIILLQSNIKTLKKEHDHKMKMFRQQETEEKLLNDKNKKRENVKQGEESQYLVVKERMRQLKHEIHKKFEEEYEKNKTQLGNSERMLEVYQFERQKNKAKLKELNEEIANLYLNILKEGQDLRSEGLRWVVKSLWNLGEYIPISSFPRFLDEGSIYFLLSAAEKEINIEHIHGKIEKMRQDIKNSRKNSSISSASELFKSVKTRLREISKSVIACPINQSKLSGYRHQMFSKIEEKNNSYSDIVMYRTSIIKFNEELKENTEAEIKRVTENYEICPGEAEKVGIFHLIRALVGEKVREFNKYTRKKIKNSRLSNN